VKEESSSDEEEEEPVVPLGKSYNALLKSFGHATASEPRKQKRRIGKDDVVSEEDIEDVRSEDNEAEEVADGANGEGDHPEDSDVEDATDPFESHFGNPDKDVLAHSVKAIAAKLWKVEKLASQTAGRMTIFNPTIKQAEAQVQRRMLSVRDMKLKKRLLEPANRAISHFGPLETALMPAISNYQDVLYGGRTPANADSLRNMACLHALNHVFKTRDRILKNNARLVKDVDKSLQFRDQGFTRPKVLILLETRQSCVRYMDTITDLCEPDQQENKKRFQDAFVQSEEKYSEDRPLDFRELFEGNDDNEFRLGVKFTRKTLKYYSQFYSSDIILASPLGLRRAIRADECVFIILVNINS